jgi:hypothetical protein
VLIMSKGGHVKSNPLLSIPSMINSRPLNTALSTESAF